MEIETPSEGNGKKSTFDKDFEFDCKIFTFEVDITEIGI